MHLIPERIARYMAIAGGIVLSLLIFLTCLSVLGRGLNGILHGQLGSFAPGLTQRLLDLGIGPITGDFELVEAGIAFSVFAFLPLCQISAGHASVDFFTNLMPTRANRFLLMIVDIVFAAILILIVWKLYDGMQAKRGYNETTFLLQFPIWWSYAASLFPAGLAAFAGVYVAGVRIAEFALNRRFLPQGREHDL